MRAVAINVSHVRPMREQHTVPQMATVFVYRKGQMRHAVITVVMFVPIHKEQRPAPVVVIVPVSQWENRGLAATQSA